MEKGINTVEQTLFFTATEEVSVLNTLENGRYLRRKIFNTFMTGLVTSLAAVSVATLALILLAIMTNGISGITPDLFLKDAIHGGIGHAILGTLEILAVAGLMSDPPGNTPPALLSGNCRSW